MANHIRVYEATREDFGAMAHIFITSFEYDEIARLLYHHDQIWPVIIEMLTRYLADDYTYLMVAWDERLQTICGWISISLVTDDQDDYFDFCDSTVWAGRELMRRERAIRVGPQDTDELKRTHLIRILREQNRDGQNRTFGGQERLVINTIAIDSNYQGGIAFTLLQGARRQATRIGLPIWGQIPEQTVGNLEETLECVGFDEEDSFELDLGPYANEEDQRRQNFGVQRWTQWLLRTGS